MRLFTECSQEARSLLLVLLLLELILTLAAELSVSGRRAAVMGIALFAAESIWLSGLCYLNQFPEKADRFIPGWNGPMIFLWCMAIFLLAVDIAYIVKGYKKSQRQLSKGSIKEAFDNLPAGICFFTSDGILVLCNHTMYRLVFQLAGKELQWREDLLEAYRNPAKGIRLADSELSAYVFQDETVWQFQEKNIQDRKGHLYTQVIASDITDVYNKKKELERDTREATRMSVKMRGVLENITAIIREEEILNLKMRVHDDVGRSVLATRKFLRQERGAENEKTLMPIWKNTVNLLERGNQEPEAKDMFAQLEEAASGIGVNIILKGKLPVENKVAYLMISALRECATNVVRHADGNIIYAVITESAGEAEITITNNGSAPGKEITEGGGLRSLRKKTENMGGIMKLQSVPEFRMTIKVPTGRREGL